LLLVHGLLEAAVPVPSKSEVVPTAKVVVPVITGKAFTVTVTSSVAVQPLPSVPVTVYVVVLLGVNAWPSVIPLVQL
jgi:hypothetical protein